MCKGIITEIQRFSTEDGPGIRSTVFCKGCNNYCLWCHNPETIKKEPEIMFFENLCVNCGLCKKEGAKYCRSGALKICGKSISAKETADILLEDKPFYDASGGGVTFSGGEPLLQHEFILETAKILKEHGIHIIIDTALNVDYKIIEELNPHADCYFADLKGVDFIKCLKYTGVDLNLVVSNMKKLISDGKEVVIRMPVIPGYSDSFEYMDKAKKIIDDMGTKNVNLLPFHNLGEAKYRALGLDYKYKDAKPIEKEKIKELEKVFKRRD